MPVLWAEPLTTLKGDFPVVDFRHSTCAKEYKLEAKRGPSGRKIPDGAYDTMTARPIAVEAVGRPEFTLADVYAHEAALAALYPGNNNVRPKIRQQLQVLRDRG